MPWTLSLVCRSWAHVARRSSSLWLAGVPLVDLTASSSRNRNQKLLLRVERSRNRPLRVAINARESSTGGRIGGRTLLALQQALLARSRQWTELSMELAIWPLRALRVGAFNLSSLKYVHFAGRLCPNGLEPFSSQYTRAVSTTIGNMLSHAPSLQQLALDHLGDCSIGSVPKMLSLFEYQSRSTALCSHLAVLKASPHLRHASIQCGHVECCHHRADFLLSSSSLAPHKYLITLCLSVDEWGTFDETKQSRLDGMQHLLKSLTLPSLKNLIVSEGRDTRPNRIVFGVLTDIRYLLLRSNCELDSFVFQSFAACHLLSSIIKSQRNLKEISLHMRNLLSLPNLLPAIQACLTLRRLELFSLDHPIEQYDASYFQPVAAMLALMRSRKVSVAFDEPLHAFWRRSPSYTREFPSNHGDTDRWQRTHFYFGVLSGLWERRNATEQQSLLSDSIDFRSWDCKKDYECALC